MSAAPSAADAPLWTPSAGRIAHAQITAYVGWLRERRGLAFDDYASLWRWSVSDLEGFWGSIAEYMSVRFHRRAERVLGARTMPGAQWFPGSTLNFAEHCLAQAEAPDAARRPALIARSEAGDERTVTWAGLAAETGALAATLRRLGVRAGDRVVSYMPNIPPTTVAVLATASIGAIWSSVSPDMGTVGVLDRFRQIAPKVLIAVDGYRYGGRDYDRRDVLAQLVAELPSLEAVVFVAWRDPQASFAPPAGRAVRTVSWAEAIAGGEAPVFEPMPFDAPLWIVYSSGTTGTPKPIVHGHGGTVLEGLKAGHLHQDLAAGDRYLWFTSTNWIMWNAQVSALMTGASVLMFDGNPGHPDLSPLYRFADEARATLLGISPAFIALCIKQGFVPNAHFRLEALRTVGVTGSPLTDEGFRWIYASIRDDVMPAVISGGTDPGAAFTGGCAWLPAWAGEMQCRCLGSATYAFDEAGRELVDEVGELVVTEPMPSMPLFFWGDTDGRRYHDSYFVEYPGKWRHGDWLKITSRGTAIIYGRSDSTINRHGIRMGTSELYRVVEGFEEIADSLVVDLEYLGRPSFMALFVVPRPGHALDGALRERLRAAIRTQLSARHVPDDVLEIPEVPRTLSGKKLEVPVKRILLGHPVEQAVNRASMANPASIDWFVAFAARRAG